jgi:sodium/potassium-transporting ATPase subunit alpha
LTEGLKEADAVAKNREFGDNRLSEKKKTPWWIKLIEEMFQPFSCLLWIASLLCIILYASDPGATDSVQNLYLAIVLICIILITGYVTFK